MFHGALSFQQSLRTWAVAPTTNIKDMFDDTFDVILRPRDRRFGLLPETVSFPDGDMDQLPLAMLLHGLYARLPIDICREIRRTLWEPLSNRTMLNAVNEWGSGGNSRWGPIELWDVRQVTNMTSVFCSEVTFNEDLSRWDVSHVTSMDLTFDCCERFNNNIGTWNVSQVNDMR
eukprot:gene25260-gene22787